MGVEKGSSVKVSDILNEGILDDIVAEFPDGEDKDSHIFDPDEKLPRKKYGSKSVMVKSKNPNTFVVYLRSPGEVHQTLAEHDMLYSLDNVVKLYTKFNYAVADNVILEFPIEQFTRYREYDRNILDKRTGKKWIGEPPTDNQIYYHGDIERSKHSGKGYIELKREIRKGFDAKKGALIMIIQRDSDKVKVYLGEGNHRHKIAQELGLKVLPARFSYRK